VNVIQGCTCCGDCDVFEDDYARAFFTVGAPITYAGNTGSWSISSNAARCSTSDRYVVASGMPSFPNGQKWYVGIQTAATVYDVIVNWRSTSDYDFVRYTSGAALEIYERVGGFDTLKASDAFHTGGSDFFVYRYGTHLAVLYDSAFIIDGQYLIATDMAAFDTSSTVGYRLHSGGPLDVGDVDLDQNGGSCPEFDPRCIACDIEDTEASTVSVELTGATGDAASLNGTYTLDYVGTRAGRLVGGDPYLQCVWRYTSGTITVTAYIECNTDAGTGLGMTIQFGDSSPTPDASGAFFDELASGYYPCDTTTYSPGLEGGATSGFSGSTCTANINP